MMVGVVEVVVGTAEAAAAAAVEGTVAEEEEGGEAETSGPEIGERASLSNFCGFSKMDVILGDGRGRFNFQRRWSRQVIAYPLRESMVPGCGEGLLESAARSASSSLFCDEAQRPHTAESLCPKL